MDPVSIGLALASLASAVYGRSAANKTAQQGLAFQQQNLANALRDARSTQLERTRQAGAFRQDQFGNATYYDPNQGRWISTYTPQQQRLLQGDQARQERALTRGAQASEDYAQQRAGYLYKQPPTEGLIQQQIMDLIRESQGTGERALNTLTDRWGTRTAGNIPTLTQMDRGPSPSQQLAETMLKARAAGLSEYGARQKQHAEQYLPAMDAFEKTANYVPQEGPFGKDLSALTSSGVGAMQAAMSDYGKQLAAIYGRGGQDAASAYATATKAAGDTPNLSQFAQLINALKINDKSKTTGSGSVTPISSGTSFDNTGAGGSPNPYSGGAGIGLANSSGVFSPDLPGGYGPARLTPNPAAEGNTGIGIGLDYEFPMNPTNRGMWASDWTFG